VSGGLCSHISAEAAIYGGLCEVLERDAINVSWYTDAAPRNVRLDTLHAEIQPFVRRLSADNSIARLLYHPTAIPGVPCFSFVSRQEWLARRRYCAGGACELDPLAALRSSAVEHGQSRSIVDLAIYAPRGVTGRTVEKMFDWDPGKSLAEMELFIQAIGYYGNPEFEGELDDYLNGPDTTWPELVEELEAAIEPHRSDTALDTLLGAAAAAGLDPIVVDFSVPEHRQLAIKKVFEPRLTTGFLQSRPVLGHPRLQPLRPGVIRDGVPSPLPYP
jgi:ribosomal protein S12 methylthiotransferase accessory factor